MIFLKTIFFILFTVLLIFNLFFAIKSKKPISFIALNSFLGVTCYLILYFIKDIINISLGFNGFVLLTNSFFGLPSVIIFLILNLFILVWQIWDGLICIIALKGELFCLNLYSVYHQAVKQLLF